jgi:hypothetical protein
LVLVAPADAVEPIDACNIMKSEFPAVVKLPDKLPPIETFAEPGADVATADVAYALAVVVGATYAVTCPVKFTTSAVT